MIVDRAAQLVIGNLGWVDKGSLWTYHVPTGKERHIPISETRYLSLRQGENGFFRLVHHYNPERTISIRNSADPTGVCAQVTLKDGRAQFSGDSALWSSVETMGVASTDSGFALFRIDAKERRVVDLDLQWYAHGDYDLMYQGLLDCIALPGEGFGIVAIQRSSKLVVIDTRTGHKVDTIALADRHGNPSLCMRTDNIILADDYDTMCRVDVPSRKVVAQARLQEGSKLVMRQFIGNYYLSANGTCALARPFSGDVLLLDSNDFKVTGRAAVDGQPLSICMTSAHDVVTRDWKTGKVATARFA